MKNGFSRRQLLGVGSLTVGLTLAGCTEQDDVQDENETSTPDEEDPDGSSEGDDNVSNEDVEGEDEGESEERETEEESSPEFTVTSLSVYPDSVRVNEEVTITTEVENTGGIEDRFESELLIDDSVVESVETDLEPGDVTEFNFVYTPGEKGTFEVHFADATAVFEATVTEVGGVIDADTTWERQESPFEVTASVQVPEGVTLTIEPGVTVFSSTDLGRDSVFRLNGVIIAEGTEDNQITIDGRGNSGTFFDADGSSPDGYLCVERCHIKDGGEFWWHGNAGFDLRYSTLENVEGSYIWYPFGREGGTIDIEYNEFINSGGFATGHRGDATINIRHNLFRGGEEVVYGGVINNWASYDDSETVVEYNSFEELEGTVVLKLPPGYDSADLTGINNWWGTTDGDTIEGMIFDENDDIDSAGEISYLPYLDDPDPDTPS